ncbi:MAG: YlxR family protein [Desulforhopalus sp.]
MSSPQRTCCVCKKKHQKKRLQRFVWRDNSVEADPQQSLPGRGAYCCQSDQCLQLFWQKKKKWKRLFRL